MTTQCIITAGICAGCDETFPIGGEAKVCSSCNSPDVRDNYDMSEHEDKNSYCWAYCTHCHEKIVYRIFRWEHGDYDEDDLPEPLFPSDEEGTEEEGTPLLWMSMMALLGIGIVMW